MKSLFVIFKGQVIGVGFRFTIKQSADKLNITGWIKNESDNLVHAVFNTDYPNFKKLINLTLKTNSFIIIDDYHLKEIDANKNDDFKIIY